MTTELATVNPAHIAPLAGPNPAAVYLASLGSAHSRRTMEGRLNLIADIAAPGYTMDTLPWAALRYEHVAAIRAQLAERGSAATANLGLAALRGVLKTAWRLGQMSAEDCMRACDVKRVKGSSIDQAAGRALAMGEIMAMATACNDGTPGGARDTAILALGYAAGLRRSEIVGLDLANVDLATGMLIVVQGKGNKARTLAIHNGALAAVKAWIDVRGTEPGPLFVAVNKAGKLGTGRLNSQTVYSALARLAKAAGVAEFSPHDLRRTFAGDSLDAGVDIATLQRIMGHASATTTAGYDRRGERAKLDAAKRLHFPYQGKGA